MTRRNLFRSLARLPLFRRCAPAAAPPQPVRLSYAFLTKSGKLIPPDWRASIQEQQRRQTYAAKQNLRAAEDFISESWNKVFESAVTRVPVPTLSSELSRFFDEHRRQTNEATDLLLRQSFYKR